MSGPYTLSKLDYFHCRQMGDFTLLPGVTKRAKTRATLTEPRAKLLTALRKNNGVPVAPDIAMRAAGYPEPIQSYAELNTLTNLWPTLWQDDEGRIGLG